MATVCCAPYVQPLTIRAGGIVSHHAARGGIVENRVVESIDSRSEFARAYGTQIRFVGGGSCTVRDIVTYTPRPKMTASQLRSEVESRGTESHFFDRTTMRFFGDRMSNYGCRPAVIDTWSESGVPVWELYRRRPVKNGLRSSTYFRRDTFARTFKKA